MKLKPLMGYVLIEPSDPIKQTATGLYIPDEAQERPAEGIVISVGIDIEEPNRTLKCPVKVGDKVIYKKWGGDEVKVDEKELKLVRFDDLMAISQEAK